MMSFLDSREHRIVVALMFWVILLPTLAAGVAPKKKNVPSDRLLNAIMMVESGGKDVMGDKNLARGPFQIHYEYWFDATEFDKTIKGGYNDVSNKDYAIKIVKAYMNRYAPVNATPAQFCMIHNGGSGGLKNKNAQAYAERVHKMYVKLYNEEW